LQLLMQSQQVGCSDMQGLQCTAGRIVAVKTNVDSRWDLMVWLKALGSTIQHCSVSRDSGRRRVVNNSLAQTTVSDPKQRRCCMASQAMLQFLWPSVAISSNASFPRVWESASEQQAGQPFPQLLQQMTFPPAGGFAHAAGSICMAAYGRLHGPQPG
jgi:hypothetical protein